MYAIIHGILGKVRFLEESNHSGDEFNIELIMKNRKRVIFKHVTLNDVKFLKDLQDLQEER